MTVGESLLCDSASKNSLFFPTSTGTAGFCGSSVIMCHWSRPMLLCIRQKKKKKKCVTSEMVAYIEQWFRGLVSELNYCGDWCSVMFHAVYLWCAEKARRLDARRKTETTDLIVLTFSKRLHICLDSAVASHCFVCVLTIFPSNLCCQPTCAPIC